MNAYLNWAKQERRDFMVWSGATPRLVVIEPDSIRQVLFAGDDFVRNAYAVRKLFGKGIVGLEGEPWRQRRALYLEAFRGAALDPLVSIVQEEAEALIGRWRDRGPETFGPARELSFCLLRILGRFVFGFEFDHARHGGRPLHRAMVTLASDAVMRLYAPDGLVGLANRKRLAQARAHLDGLCAQLLERGGDTPFMQALRGGLARGELDREAALDELRTFLIAGQETSATATAWGLAVFAEQGLRAAAVREEGRAAPSMTRPAELQRLEHSTRWTKEVLRLYPAVPLTTTLATRDVVLGRFEVPAGAQVDVSCFVQHRLPWLWDQPERFDPSRFERPPSFGSYLPFLLGPHTCLGMRMAMIELPLILARLAAAFEFELPEGPPRPNLRVSLHPAGLRVRARPRRLSRSVPRSPTSAAGRLRAG